MNRPIRILNMGDFERELGGLDERSEASYAIQQFFLNGGTEAWVVRTASGQFAEANVEIGSAISAAPPALTVTAINEGVWGNNLRVRVDTNTPTVGEFNLIISEYTTVGDRATIVRQETFRNLSMVSTNKRFAGKVVNDPNSGSKLVRVETNGAGAPLANGTLSDAHASNPTISPHPAVDITIGIITKSDVDLKFPSDIGLPMAVELTKIAPVLEAAIRGAEPAHRAFADATVQVVGNRLHVLCGPADPTTCVTFANSGANTTADDLLLTTTATVNSQEYTLGGGPVANTAQLGGTSGNDGNSPNGAALIGDLGTKRGIYALEDADLFNLLCIPRAAIVDGTDGLTPSDAQAVIATAQAYCEKRRAFFLIDTPRNVDEPREIENELKRISRHCNAALYYPRVRIPDPLNEFRLRSVGASGTIAGLFARIDSSRGVWKAPAGTEATLRNVSELEDLLTDQENGILNPVAINCLRSLPVFGIVCWGARTLDGGDQQASEWKYIPVRRMALFIEESLYRGTKWVVFEPNDEPLWAQIRLNVGAFMHNLFRQGAFAGKTPGEAYFVKCDKETNTQDDVNRGIVNIMVGFAPLKPAEFVIIKIQQIRGQIPT